MPEARTEDSEGRDGAVDDVLIPPVGLQGILNLPQDSAGVVLFAHGSGSSRLSPRNTYVAAALRTAGLGTLLFDLLTEDEAFDRANIFDIPLLAERLLMATEWLRGRHVSRGLELGYFGASTGAAAALVAASRAPTPVGAVVSRGGRPDLAGPVLAGVEAPTLLIVGGFDRDVLALNEAAFAQLRCKKALEVVPGASHLFEEPGTLDAAIELAKQWFTRHLGPPAMV